MANGGQGLGQTASGFGFGGGQGFGGYSQPSYGGFGGFGGGAQPSYGGFGQGFGGYSQPSYGGFGQNYNAYAPGFNATQQNTSAIQPSYETPTYGFGNFTGTQLQNYVNKNRTLQPTDTTAANLPTTAPTDATGNSGNAVWDKLVTDFTASHPNFQPGQGWQVNPDTQAAYADLAKQYQTQVGQQASQTAQQAANPVYDYNGQNIAAAMQQYGVSANDLARSGALSQADYTRTFRPSGQYQTTLNPTQFYQPIYQPQYQSYAAPGYNYMGQNQQYRNPMSFGNQGYGIDSILGQLGGYLDRYMSKYQQPATTAATTQTTAPAATDNTQTTAPATTGTTQTTAPATTGITTPSYGGASVAGAAPLTQADLDKLKTSGASLFSAGNVSDQSIANNKSNQTATPTSATTPAATPAPTYGALNVTGKQISDFIEQNKKSDPNAIFKAAKDYGLSDAEIAKASGYGLDEIAAYRNAHGGKEGGLMSLLKR